jgi:chemotaxis protein CheD
MEIMVGMGEFKVTGPPALLIAIGLGSCVAVALYDKETRIGGLAHTMLPYLREAHDNSHPTRFTDFAIHEMINQMSRRGARLKDLRAKIFGGANMFPEIISSASNIDVGQRNVAAVRDELRKHNVPIVAEEVGGHAGRTVLFDPEDGSVVVKTAYLEERKY